jgi:hypothetical protein
MLINIMLNVNMLIVERNFLSECHYAFIISLTIFSFYSRRARSHTN